jgi:hypothetical protein
MAAEYGSDGQRGRGGKRSLALGFRRARALLVDDDDILGFPEEKGVDVEMQGIEGSSCAWSESLIAPCYKVEAWLEVAQASGALVELRFIGSPREKF